MTKVRIALFTNRSFADSIQQRFAAAGFPAVIEEGPPLSRLWFVPKSACGVRVNVPAEDFERAYQLLLRWDAAGAIAGAIRCPECHSYRVDYPQFTRKSLLTNLAMGLMAELRLLQKEYYCEDCHFTWPREGQKSSPARPHTAPYYFIEGVAQPGEHAQSTDGERPPENVYGGVAGRHTNQLTKSSKRVWSARPQSHHGQRRGGLNQQCSGG